MASGRHFCILQVKERVFDAGPHGHSDQVPYVITWESLALDPPPWEAPFVTKKPRVPNATAMVPTSPPAQFSLYPLLEKEKLEARPKPVLPPEDPVLVDLLSENPPPYQAPPRLAASRPFPSLRRGPLPRHHQCRQTREQAPHPLSPPSYACEGIQGREGRENGHLSCSL